MVFQSNSFCNSFLQHYPTPLAGHRQEKTEKTDGSAEPSAKTGILSLSDTYTHPQWRESDDNGIGRVGASPFLLVRFPKSPQGLYGLSKDPGGLQKQHQHHHRGNIADHHPVELLAAEGLAVALHLVNDVIRRHDPANQDGGQQGNERHHDAVADVVHDIQQLSRRAVGQLYLV